MHETDWVVGIAEIRTAKSPDRLVAYGLGSCVGIALYDPLLKLGGLAHPMLPSSRFHPLSKSKGKFVDSALEELIHQMVGEGGEISRFQAKLIGGANMFNSIIKTPLTIGVRNAMAAREVLGNRQISIVGEEVGGTQGRTVYFSLSDGMAQIRKFNQEDVRI